MFDSLWCGKQRLAVRPLPGEKHLLLIFALQLRAPVTLVRQSGVTAQECNADSYGDGGPDNQDNDMCEIGIET